MERRTPFEHRHASTSWLSPGLLWGLIALCGATFFGLPRADGSDLDGDVFEHRKLDIRFTVPEGWKLTRQTGYPSLLAFVGRGSSRIALSYTRLARQQKIIQIVTDNSRALEALGLRVDAPKNSERLGRKLWQVQARTADGQRSNQQLYVPAGQVVYVLTLSAPSSEIQRAQVDLDYLLASMKFKHWPLADEELVREQGRQGATKPPTPQSPTTTRTLPELSSGGSLSGGSLPTEHGEEPQTKAAPRDVQEHAQGRGRRARPKPTSAPASGPATRPSVKSAPKLPTTGSRSQTR